MALPKVDERHECKQSEQLVGIVEEQRDEIERLTTAVEFHRRDADELRQALKQSKRAEEAHVSR